MFGPRENTLWVEKFRPDTLDGYIGNEHVISKIKLWLDAQDVPHLLFYGPAGTGKTTLAKIIINNLDCDHMYINASDENNVDTIRTKVKGFASTMSFKKWKIIILDESDFMTPNAQAMLRNLMEEFSKHTRFILTCNYVEKIIDPIQSRCQVFGITPPSRKEVAKRLASIMTELGVEFDLPDIVTIINNTYPDIRKAINAAQSSVVGNKLKVDEHSVIQANYMTEVLDVLKSVRSGKVDAKTAFKTIRQTIADSKVRDFTQLYTFLYSNLDEFAEGHIGPTIIILADGQFEEAHVADKEIAIMKVMTKLLQELL